MGYLGNKKSLAFKDCFWIWSRNFLKYQMRNVHRDHTFYSLNWKNRQHHFSKKNFYFASAENRPSGDLSDNLESSLPDKDFSAPKTIPQEAVFTSRPEHEAHAPKVITSQGSRSSTLSSMAQSKANMVSAQVLILKFLKNCKPWWFIKDLPSYLVILYTFLA